MTAPLDQEIQAIRELPAERQDGRQGASVLAVNVPRNELTAEQIEYLKLGFPQAGRVEFSSDGKAAKTWQKFAWWSCDLRRKHFDI
jgi:hypothetical protein